MRKQYKINSMHCHFHMTHDTVFHDIHDLLQLIGIPANTQVDVIDLWRGKLKSLQCKTISGDTNFLVIPEKQLLSFLTSAITAHPGKSIANAETLFKRILNERLDAIVENLSPHALPSASNARRQMLEASKAAFLTMSGLMNKFENEGILGAEKKLQWGRIKSLFPDVTGTINERHFYALLVLIAPIWPSAFSPSASFPEKTQHLTLSIFVDMIKSDKMEQPMKPLFFQKAFLKLNKVQRSDKSQSPEP